MEKMILISLAGLSFWVASKGTEGLDLTDSQFWMIYMGLLIGFNLIRIAFS